MTSSNPGTYTVTSPPPSSAPRLNIRPRYAVAPSGNLSGASLMETKAVEKVLRKKSPLWIQMIKWAIFIFFFAGGSGSLAAHYNPQYAQGFYLVLVAMGVLWGATLPLHDITYLDSAWGFGFVILSWFYRYLRTGVTIQNEESEEQPQGFRISRGLLVSLLTTLWGVRLGYYLFKRHMGSSGEDPRYAAFRRQFHPHFWWFSFIQSFLMQATSLWLVSYPLYASQGSSPRLWSTWRDWVGIFTYGIGLYFEVVGDHQLSQFRRNPNNRGRLLNTGLWSLSRHPNYFGDSCVWWGLALLASSASGGNYSFLSAALMTFFLRFISGVPLMDNALRKSGKAGIQEYFKTTNAFFPKLF